MANPSRNAQHEPSEKFEKPQSEPFPLKLSTGVRKRFSSWEISNLI